MGNFPTFKSQISHFNLSCFLQVSSHAIIKRTIIDTSKLTYKYNTEQSRELPIWGTERIRADFRPVGRLPLRRFVCKRRSRLSIKTLLITIIVGGKFGRETFFLPLTFNVTAHAERVDPWALERVFLVWVLFRVLFVSRVERFGDRVLLATLIVADGFHLFF